MLKIFLTNGTLTNGMLMDKFYKKSTENEQFSPTWSKRWKALQKEMKEHAFWWSN